MEIPRLFAHFLKLFALQKKIVYCTRFTFVNGVGKFIVASCSKGATRRLITSLRSQPRPRLRANLRPQWFPG